MDFDLPDDAAYGRVTDPERFQVVADAALALVDDLVDTYDVAVTPGTAADDFPTWREPDGATIRLVPASGTPLAFLITEFPGVVVRFGEWATEAFPSCGCDACDEDPTDEIERMRRLVEAAVGGRYEERLSKRELHHSFAGSWGRAAGEERLRRGEWRKRGTPGAHTWPPWPRRDAG